MSDRRQRPAKRVIFSASDTQYITPNGGGQAKLFKGVTEAFKNELVGNIDSSLALLTTNNLRAIPMIVELEPGAIAKSHRPTSIFNDTTCPFVGDIGIDVESKTGQFLIRATSMGLNQLKRRILTVSGETPSAALSTVKEIRQYYPEFSVQDLAEDNHFLIRLADLNDDALNEWADAKFRALLGEFDAEYMRVSESMLLYSVKLAVNSSSSFLERVQANPNVLTVEKANAVNALPSSTAPISDVAISAPPPETDVEYPVVAVVDSAIRSECPNIAPWYVGEETAIIEAEKDYSHGTFVAGIISNAFNLNYKRSDFPVSQSRVFSVGVLTERGGNIDEIIDVMWRAHADHPYIKVWNLSLGVDAPTSLRSISDFAIMLDEFQQNTETLCVVSAGNINNISHQREWPPAPHCPLDEQRISPPGDTVLGITVASLAHVDGLVSANDPSSFSRSGPIANYVLKPDLSHFGGNYADQTHFQPIGVVSIAGQDPGNCAFTHDIGTSFSTPMVSTIAANLWQVMGDDVKRHTIKGLLAHSARLRQEVPQDHKIYYGWGMPMDVEEYLYCDANEITIIMEGDIGNNQEVVGKLPFPIPDSLRTDSGKVRGEFFVTVAYDPPLDPKRALEYCLVNIDVGLGEITDSGKFNGKIPAEGTGFEQELINGRYKWSPVKVYHKRFANGVDVENWKLQIKMLSREGFVAPEGFRQPFTVIITIRGLEPEAMVYDEMVRQMEQFNWEVSNAVVVEPQIRV